MNKEKILSIKGGEFKEWYNSLDEASKLTYRQVRKEMEENFGNNFKGRDIRELSEEIIHLVLESEDDYEATYIVEDIIKKYLKRKKNANII